MASAYFTQLTEAITGGWNRFWFRRDDPFTVCVLRIVVGVVALGYVLSYTPELAIWFSDGGVLPVDRTHRLTGAADPTINVYYWSLLDLARSSTQLYVLHALALVAIGLFTIGLKTRIAAVVAAVFVLSYAQRAPMLSGLIEPILCPVMIYLCLAPCGAYLSVDRWLRRRSASAAAEPVEPSMMAHLATRLVQVHVSMLYLMMAYSKLGSVFWWNGEAMWWVIAQPDSGLVDFTFLRSAPLVVFAWTHLVVLFELGFGIFIWFRLARPMLAGLAVVHWTLLALVTGHVGFAILMMGLSLAFAPWQVTRATAEAPTLTRPTKTVASPAKAAV